MTPRPQPPEGCSTQFAITSLDDCFVENGCDTQYQEMCLASGRCVPGEVGEIVSVTDSEIDLAAEVSFECGSRFSGVNVCNRARLEGPGSLCVVACVVGVQV